MGGMEQRMSAQAKPSPNNQKTENQAQVQQKTARDYPAHQ